MMHTAGHTGRAACHCPLSNHFGAKAGCDKTYKGLLRRFSLAIVLALLLCCRVSAFAIDIPEHVTPLALDTAYELELEMYGESAFFSFVPSETATYLFSAPFGEDSMGGHILTLYDAAGNELAHLDLDPYDDAFMLSRRLTAGTLYYYRVELTDPEAMGAYTEHFTVQVSKIDGIPDNVPWLTTLEGRAAEIKNAGERAYYSFTPSSTGRYKFTVAGMSNAVYLVIFDEYGTVIAHQVGYAQDGAGSIMRDLTAGKLYYFGSWYLDEGWIGRFSVNVKQLETPKPHIIPSYVPDIQLDTPLVYNEDDFRSFYRFTPYETGDYVFFSTGNPNPDAVVTLYDINENVLASDSNGGFEEDFALVYTLSENVPYYYCVEYPWNPIEMWEDDPEISVQIKRDTGLRAETVGSTAYTVLSSEETSCSFLTDASCTLGDVHYQWCVHNPRFYRYEDIEGATGSSYDTGTRSFTGDLRYLCVVRGDYGREIELAYTIHTDNQLSAQAVCPQTITLLESGDAIMGVRADCLLGQPRFQWYELRYNPRKEVPLDGAQGNWFTAQKVDSETDYLCRVTDDYSTDSLDFLFQVRPDSSVAMVHVGDIQCYAVVGESYMLRVPAGEEPADFEWGSFVSAGGVELNPLYRGGAELVDHSGVSLALAAGENYNEYTGYEQIRCVAAGSGGTRYFNYYVTLVDAGTDMEPNRPYLETVAVSPVLQGFRFTPTVSGRYRFTSSSSGAMLLDTAGNQTKAADVSESGFVFSLTAGKTYVFVPGVWQGSDGTWKADASVERLGADITHFEKRLVLPAGLREIKAEAFSGDSSVQEVIIPDGCQSIGALAFDGCTDLRLIFFPDSVTHIAEDAFPPGADSKLFVCASENEAYRFAVAHNIECMILDYTAGVDLHF